MSIPLASITNYYLKTNVAEGAAEKIPSYLHKTRFGSFAGGHYDYVESH